MKTIGVGDRVITNIFSFTGYHGEVVKVIDNFADVVFDDYKPSTKGLDPKTPFRFRMVELERL